MQLGLRINVKVVTLPAQVSAKTLRSEISILKTGPLGRVGRVLGRHPERWPDAQ